jgi:hypothetical protein
VEHTKIEATLQLLPNSHQLHSSPEIWPIRFWHTECPTSTIYVSSILPHWLKALFEKVYRFAHLDVLNRCIIVVPPEVLDGLDLRPELLEGGRIRAICGFRLLLLLSRRMLDSVPFTSHVLKGQMEQFVVSITRLTCQNKHSSNAA